MPSIKLAAVSLESRPGDKLGNLDNIAKWSDQAVSQGARLLVFPAMAVTGYWRTSRVAPYAEILTADLTNPALIHPTGPSVQRLEALAKSLKIWLAAGMVEDFDYYHLRNSVAVFGPAGVLGTAAEMHTPIEPHSTYFAGRNCPVFDLGGVSAGLLVGEDAWYPEVARTLAAQGARLLIAAMDPPLEDDPEIAARQRGQMAALLATRAVENGVALVAVEPAGSVRNASEESCYRFSGQVTAFNAHGQCVGETPGDGREHMLVVDLEVPDGPCKRLSRRRPSLYQPLVAEEEPHDVPGTRPEDWDAQGEILWSRLRDLGLFCVDLYTRQATDFKARNQAVVVTAGSLPPLAGYRAVLLTRPCLAHLPDQEAAKLPEWVAAGGTLILDGYCGRNRGVLGPLTGIDSPMRKELYLPSYRDASRVTVRFEPEIGDAVFGSMEQGRHSKIWGQVWIPEQMECVTASPLAWLRSPKGQRLAPALYQHAVGAGRVYAFAYSSAYSQLLLMQGRGTMRDLGGFPERVAPGSPRDGDVNTWGDQVVTDQDDQYFPSSDYHLIPVLNIMLGAGASVLISPVPQGKECGVIFTGDADHADAGAINRYTDLLAGFGIRPTQFMLRDGPNAQEVNPNCEYGIHPLFDETEAACLEALVARGFEPGRLICGRRHCLIQYGLTDTLERMAACGIRYTSNNWDFPYPPTLSTAFLFGTAMPHHVYSWEGQRIGIVDIPQVFMDYQPVLECSQAAYASVRRTHSVGAWNFHPQNQVMPGVKEAIEWLARQVGQDDAWCGTMGEYGEWYRQRDLLAVSGDDRAVTLHGEPPAGLALLSPQRELTINGRTSRAQRPSTWYGREYWVHVVGVPASAEDLDSSCMGGTTHVRGIDSPGGRAVQPFGSGHLPQGR